jgi:putative flippase GtrA
MTREMADHVHEVLGPGLRPDVVRFLFVGASNLVGVYAIYLGALHWVTPIVAAAIAIAAGIAYTTVLNITFVFRRNITIGKFGASLLYQLVYGVANVGLFDLFLKLLPLPPWATPLAVMCIMVPIHFVCSKLIAIGRFPKRNNKG